MRIRKRRILPATWPSTVWPLSSWTRNMAFGSASTTSPSNSTFSSLGTSGPPAGRYSTARTGAAALTAALAVAVAAALRRHLRRRLVEVRVGVVADAGLLLVLAPVRLGSRAAVAGGPRRGRHRRRRRPVGVGAARRHALVGARRATDGVVAEERRALEGHRRLGELAATPLRRPLHEVVPDQRGRRAAEHLAVGRDVGHRDRALRIAHPHSGVQAGGEAVEPGVGEVRRRAGLAGDRAADLRGGAGAALDVGLHRLDRLVGLAVREDLLALLAR